MRQNTILFIIPQREHVNIDRHDRTLWSIRITIFNSVTFIIKGRVKDRLSYLCLLVFLLSQIFVLFSVQIFLTFSVTWWRLSQKLVVCTKLGIYVFCFFLMMFTFFTIYSKMNNLWQDRIISAYNYFLRQSNWSL